MPRNKHPEKTVNRILDVSLQLFMEQGFENTSIQDIVNNLEGLSKGAIYHHFKSKEEILIAAIDQLNGARQIAWLEELRDDPGKTGLEKLRQVIDESMADGGQLPVFTAAPNLLNNPKMLALFLESIIQETAPLYLRPIVEQGVADGSIKTDYPGEVAEIILLLANIWVNPMVFHTGLEATRRRVFLYRDILRGLGLDIIGDSAMEHMDQLSETYAEKQRQATSQDSEE